MTTKIRAVLFLLVCTSAALQAQIYTFTGTGNWMETARWDLAEAPVDGSTAIVNGDCQITEDIGTSNTDNPARISIGDGATGTLTVSGGTFSGAHAGGAANGIHVGINGGTGTLIVEEGASFRSQGGGMPIVIGDDLGGTGMVSVAGTLLNYKYMQLINGTLELLPTGQDNYFNSNDQSTIGANGTLSYVIDGSNIGILARSNTMGMVLTIDPAATLKITLGGNVAINDSWTLIDYSSLTGQFAQGTSFTNEQGYTFSVDYGSGTSDLVTLTLTSDDGRPKIDALSASPPSLASGASSTLSWTTSNFDTLTLNPGNIDVTSMTSTMVSPGTTTTYTLTATKGAITVERDLTIVVDELPVINSFAASDTLIAPGQSTTLSWDVAGGDTITISPAPGTVAAVDSSVQSPITTTTYTLSATNATGTVMSDVEVRVDALDAAIIHQWDAAAPNQVSAIFFDGVGGKNFDVTGGNLLTGLTSNNSSLTASMSRVNPNAATGGDNGLGFPATSTTYEIWCRLPENLDLDPQVIFETGSPANGTSVLVSSTGARFLHSVANVTTIDLEAPIDFINPADFIQIVATLDAGTGDAELSVIGSGGGTSSASGNGTIGAPDGRASILTWSGFAGGVGTELGGIGELGAPLGTRSFAGDIGLFSIYDRPLSMAEVEEAYLRVGGAITEGDSDDDTLPDWWENVALGGLSEGPNDNNDGDMLTNAEEFEAGTNPKLADSDLDGLDDDEELALTFPSDPNNPDTDGDGILDGEEVNSLTTDPTLVDSDFDQLSDGYEVCVGSDPNDSGVLPAADDVGTPWSNLVVQGAYPSSLDVELAGDVNTDATFRLAVDFAEKLGGESEVIFESGGATIGISLLYEAGSQLVFRASGDSGLGLATASHALTAEQLAAGPLDVVVTYDIDDDLGFGNSVIAIYIDGVQVATDTAFLGGSWSGTNAGSLGAASTNMAGDGANGPLTGVDFTSGTIDPLKGLVYYIDTLFVGVIPAGIEITEINYDSVTKTVALSFISEAGKIYKVQRSGDLITPFADAATGINAVSTLTTTDPISATEASGYYIVIEE